MDISNTLSLILESVEIHDSSAPYSNIHIYAAAKKEDAYTTTKIEHSLQVGVVKVVVKTARCPVPDSRNHILDAIATRWSSIQHDRICALMGLYTLPGGQRALVTPFYRNGNIMAYLFRHPGVDKMRLIEDAASGVGYLHSIGIVHANIHPNNILIDDEGKGNISDVGFNYEMQQVLGQLSHPIPDAWQYKSHDELQFGAGAYVATMPMDIYAFGSTMYEIDVGKPPFRAGSYRFRSIKKIITAGHASLPKPDQMSGQLWDLITQCWARAAHARPTAATVVIAVKEIN